MNINLQGKTALVTGGAQGIGKGCALALAKCGATIIINDLPTQKEVNKAVSEISEITKNCTFIPADIFSKEGRTTLIEESAKLGGFDILISNPYKTVQKPILNLSIEEFESVVNAVLTSHFHIAQLASDYFVSSHKPGNIIFISSIYSILNRSHSVAYDSAKAGINQMTRVFAKELSTFKIRTNAIAPAFVDTPGEHNFATPEQIKSIHSSAPLGRACYPIDIGNIVSFLVSDLAEMITGQTYIVDGGMGLVG